MKFSRREPLVSVVTPVYNGERYLRECIESVLGQTYPHWDYTIVNNCSTDGTLDIAREYAAKDPRIRIHNNDTFVRVVRNYNIAYRQISSDSAYCKVVAADDWLFPECLEKMVSLAEAHPTVAIVGAYGLAGSRVMWTRFPYPSTVVPGRQACRWRLLEGNNFFGTATAVLFRSEIVRSRPVFQNEDNFHSDSEAYLQILEQHDVGFVHQILTFSRVREDSLTSFSQKFSTHLFGDLYELRTYGSRYLTAEELKHRIRQHESQYYRYLGQQVFKRRGADFWALHRRMLGQIGRPLSRARVVAAALGYVFDLGLNPKSTVEKAARRLWGLVDGHGSRGLIGG